ncbi:mediator of RNA polymerase II transcription subunit 6-like [Uloborus diversus]|uniref:mediator of RNA polymerase II transcription subunit 6-like n=1 Tax=Uloborus diversus TaxID=327109 RepID=UPI002409CB79|nr:mediator of RNA polymerase II transcription subunit 6-like [Uloborus diversus]
MNPDRFVGSLPHGIPKLDNPLSISWHDSSWIPMLNTNNVMDYFSERTNPFYDRTCNNENLKMQRLGIEHLGNMVGLEYCLLHVQEPILYVIRKQHRHSPTQVTPISDYYILAGVVYQAPDLASVIGSRMLTMVHHLQSAFDEAASYSQYHPSKGYWWEFKDQEKTEKVKVKEEPGSVFQRRRVDVLLGELAKKFPPKLPSPPQLEKQTTEEANVATVKVESKTEIKTEKVDTPPTTTAATTVSLPPPASVPTTTTAANAVTTTTNAVTSTTAQASTVVTSTTQSPIQRTAMKPPPEKKPRIA